MRFKQRGWSGRARDMPHYLDTSRPFSCGFITAKYCNEYVCMRVCLCVCLSVCPRGYFRNYSPELYSPIFTRFLCMLPTAVGGSVLLRRRCNMLCTSGFVNDIMFFNIMGRMAV